MVAVLNQSENMLYALYYIVYDFELYDTAIAFIKSMIDAAHQNPEAVWEPSAIQQRDWRFGGTYREFGEVT